MPRFAANVSTLYPEHPLLDRIGAAARDGFAAVEVQSPYAASATELRRALAEAERKLEAVAEMERALLEQASETELEAPPRP